MRRTKLDDSPQRSRHRKEMKKSSCIRMYRHKRTCEQVCHLLVRRRTAFTCCGQDVRDNRGIMRISKFVESHEYLGDPGVIQSGCSLCSHNTSVHPCVYIGN